MGKISESIVRRRFLKIAWIRGLRHFRQSAIRPAKASMPTCEVQVVELCKVQSLLFLGTTVLFTQQLLV